MAAFLDPLSLCSFLKSHPTANFDPTLTISIENHENLSFLQENCPHLRHLIVYSKNELNRQNELSSIRESLIHFTDLISLEIDIPHFFDINELEDLGLPNYTILPFMIPRHFTNEDVRRLLPFLQWLKKIRIGLNQGHLLILKECPKLRRLSVIQYDSDAHIEENIALIIGHLSSFNSLKSLQIGLYENDLVVDMAPLESLTELTELQLIRFDSPDLSFVSGLKKLKKLSINNARALRSIEPIAGLSQLEELDLSWSRGLGSEYASILPGMKKLKRLNLRGSRLEDVSFLVGMMTLDRLDISHCEVRDISSLSGLSIYADKQKLIWNDSTGPRRLDPRTV
jgi:hypothetical protein